jgi:hypothetical protein
MKAKIFKPSKTAMQSGRAKVKSWKLVIDDGSHETKDPLIGWNGGSTTKSQINLFFSSKEKAINYAQKNKLKYDVLESSSRRIISKSYADNFK